MLTPANTPAAIPPTSIPRPAVTPREFADVIDVSISGKPGDCRFSVTVSSPDTGCAQYADWWEVLGEDGPLLYRRVLLHSHVSEQPFTRSLSGVAIPKGIVKVRLMARDKVHGYGGAEMMVDLPR